jgi:hypothetical protein
MSPDTGLDSGDLHFRIVSAYFLLGGFGQDTSPSWAATFSSSKEMGMGWKPAVPTSQGDYEAQIR